MYDAETIPAKSAPAAECVTVRDGKIVYNRFVFDRTPFDEFRRRQAQTGAPGASRNTGDSADYPAGRSG